MTSWDIILEPAINPSRFDKFSFHADRRIKEKEKRSVSVFDKFMAANERRNAVITKKQEIAKACFEGIEMHAARIKAVNIIKQFWKRNMLARKRFHRLKQNKIADLLTDVMAEFQTEKTCTENFESFDKISARLCNKSVVSRYCSAIHHICQSHSQTLSAATGRKLLLPFMINRFSEIILVSETADSEVLWMKKLLKLLSQRFERVVVELHRNLKSNANLATNDFILKVRVLSRAFLLHFAQYKKKDANILVSQLKNSFQRIKIDCLATEREMKRAERDGVEINAGLQQFFIGLRRQLDTISSKIKSLLGSKQYAIWQEEAEKQTTKVQITWKERQVYELMRDPNYSLDSVNKQNKEIKSISGVYKVLKENLDQGNFEFFIKLLEEIKKRVNALTPSRKDLHSEVEEFIDIEFISQKLESKTYSKNDFVSLITFIFQRILTLQSPARNETTEQQIKKLETLKQETENWFDLCGVSFDYVLKELHQIELDLANFQLKLLAGVISEEQFSLTSDFENLPQGVQYILKSLKTDKRHQDLADTVEIKFSSKKDLFTFIVQLSFNKEAIPTFLSCFEESRIIALRNSVKQVCDKVSSEIHLCQKVSGVQSDLREKVRLSSNPLDTLTEVLSSFDLKPDAESLKFVSKSTEHQLKDILLRDTNGNDLNLRKTIFGHHELLVKKTVAECKMICNMTWLVFSDILKL